MVWLTALTTTILASAVAVDAASDYPAELTGPVEADAAEVFSVLSLCKEYLAPAMPGILVDVDYLGNIYLITDSVTGEYNTSLVGDLVAAFPERMVGGGISEVGSDHWCRDYTTWPDNVTHVLNGSPNRVLRAKLDDLLVTPGQHLFPWYVPERVHAADDGADLPPPADSLAADGDFGYRTLVRRYQMSEGV